MKSSNILSCLTFFAATLVVAQFAQASEPIVATDAPEEDGLTSTLPASGDIHPSSNPWLSRLIPKNPLEITFASFEERPSRSRCVPLLNLSSYVQNARNNSVQKSSDGLRSFSFSLGEISMPISPPNGSISSALKLLSSFGNQFDSLDSEEETFDEPMENAIKFRENRINLSGINLTMLSVHLPSTGEPKFGIGLTIKNITLTGRFEYVGPLALTGSPLTAFYRMSIQDTQLVASSNLTKIITNREEIEERQGQVVEHLQSKLMSGLITNDFRLNVSSMGYIEIDILDSQDSTKPSSNYLFRMLQRFLQKTIKRTYHIFEGHIKSTLEREGRKVVDCELTRFSLPLNQSHHSNSSYQHDLAIGIGNEIFKSQLDRVSLPDFSHQQTILGTSASVQFYNGSLSGLDRLRLNEETRVKIQNRHLFINTSIGWLDLNPYYKWNLTMGSSKAPMSKGFVSFNIKSVDFDAVITKGLDGHRSRIIIEQLTIKHLDKPTMDIGGLPGMNRLTRGMVNFFMNRLKQRLTDSIQPVLKQQLENSMNKLSHSPGY